MTNLEAWLGFGIPEDSVESSCAKIAAIMHNLSSCRKCPAVDFDGCCSIRDRMFCEGAFIDWARKEVPKKDLGQPIELYVCGVENEKYSECEHYAVGDRHYCRFLLRGETIKACSGKPYKRCIYHRKSAEAILIVKKGEEGEA